MSCSMMSTAISAGSCSIISMIMPALGRRHAGRGLVEQQHLGRRGPAPRRSRRGAGGHRASSLHRPQRRRRRCRAASSSANASSITARREPAGPQDVAGDAEPLADRERHVLQHREAAEQGVDLERAREPALDPLRLGQVRDVLAVEQDAARARLQRAGDEIDEGRLAGAVGADERVARARARGESRCRSRPAARRSSSQRPCVSSAASLTAPSATSGRAASASAEGAAAARTARPAPAARPIQKYQ